MITQIHFILTYMCPFSCEHCFVCSSPSAEGTFSPSQITNTLDQIDALGSVDTIYFEGGEPFLFFPVLLEGIREARKRGYSVGIVTNGYFATSRENATWFLKSLKEPGIVDISISDDVFHYETRSDNPAQRAYAAGTEMGLPVNVLALDPEGSCPEMSGTPRDAKIGIVTGGKIMFRGRAAAQLSQYAETKDSKEFTTCPYEDLRNPTRLHVDAYGNLQICQGISLGNIWQHPIQELIRKYFPETHPVCGPLLKGGPVELAKKLGYNPPEIVADACHLCWLARRACREDLPGILEPEQVYCGD